MKTENMGICPVMSVPGAKYAVCTDKCAWYLHAADNCAITLIPTTIAAAAAFLGNATLDDNRHGNK